MKKNAFVTAAHMHENVQNAVGDVILGMADNQFEDWKGVGLVREATAAEVAAHKGDRPKRASAKPKPASPRKASAKPKAAPKPAAAPVTPPLPPAED